MAMLAEPKRRQKLSTDPRNKSWSNDDSKLGEQLMKKMGWQQGKGLGLNEDGKRSHISVVVKNNSFGLGHNQKYDDTWISHQDDFNDLLSSLNQDHSANDDKKTSTSTMPQSLQEKSKKAKRRVHYNKFTQGKDLSTYSSSEMNCIMGVRSNCSTPNDKSQNQSENNSDDGSDSENCTERTGLGFASTTQHRDTPCPEGSFGVETVTSSNSIQEYFAQKMKALRQKRSLEKTSNGEAVSSSNTIANKESYESNAGLEHMEATSITTGNASAEYQGKDLCSIVCHKTGKSKKSKKKTRKCKEDKLIEKTDLSTNGEEIESNKTAEEESSILVDMSDTKRKKKKKRKAKLVESQRDCEEIVEDDEDSGKDTTDGKKRKITKTNKKRKKNKARKLENTIQDIAL